MDKFTAVIKIIGINPYVSVPSTILATIFKDAGKDKGYIAVTGTVNGKTYRQTLVKYAGSWRFYINTTMLKDSPKRVGERIVVEIKFDPKNRTIAAHPKLIKALKAAPNAKAKFDQLPPSRKKEIVRYISNLKTEAAIEKNVSRAINFLLGKERFVGREKP